MKTPRDVEGDLATEELVDPAEATASADAIIAPKDVVGRSPWEIFWRQFRKDRWALAGIVIVVIMSCWRSWLRCSRGSSITARTT